MSVKKVVAAEFKKQLLAGRVKWRTEESENVRNSNKDRIKPFQSDLNEAQIRQSFILPLIDCLGWNTEDPFEVFPEERTNGGFVDIKLRTSNGSTVIWEIKRPAVKLSLQAEEGRDAAYQGIGYARTFNNHPFTVVTNFESFYVYHSYQLPNKKDVKSNLVAQFEWTDIESGDAKEVLSLLAKEAVETGQIKDRFDELVKVRGVIRRARPLQETILSDLEKWRVLIAKDLFDGIGESTSILELDSAVQVLINRLLLIRCAEDRKLEGRAFFEPLLEESDLWVKLTNDIFPFFKASYNSDLFAENPIIDNNSYSVSDQTLKYVIKGSFGEFDKYDFSIIPLEILGSAYEQYLAKYIEIKDGEIILETKPEIKKAGGVCYTPTYIVEAIVEETLENQKRPTKTKSFKPKILDPACGSGTFLITAFDKLVKYNTKTPKKKSELPEVLSLAEKRKLLKGCIFGVDLDPRAIEITKLSLLLKLLEGEQQGQLVKQAILPQLEENIRHGNSLISPRDLASHQMSEESYRMHPLSWKQFMKKISAEKGFDVIIGNPPYVRIQNLREYYPDETAIYVDKYESASDGNVDIYVPFIERCLSFLKPKGILGYICPHRFWGNDYGTSLRQEITKNNLLYKVINFRAEQVFHGVSTYTCILLLQKSKAKSFVYVEGDEGVLPEETISKREIQGDKILVESLPKEILKESPWLLAPSKMRDEIFQLEEMPKTLKDYVDSSKGIFQGLISGSDPCYLLEKREGNSYFSKMLGKEVDLEQRLLQPTLKGSKDLRHLRSPDINLYMLFPYSQVDDQAFLMKALDETHPLTWAYLEECEEKLRERKALKTAAQRAQDLEDHPGKFEDGWYYSGGDFYKYSRTQALECIKKQKLIVPSMFKNPTFLWDEIGQYSLTGSGSGGGGAYAMFLKDDIIDKVYALIGVLSSRLLRRWFERRGDLFQGYYIGVDKKILFNTPLPDFEASELLDKIGELSNLIRSLLNSDSRLEEVRNEMIDSAETIVEEIYGV